MGCPLMDTVDCHLRHIVANSSLSDILSFVFLRRNLLLTTLTLCTYDVGHLGHVLMMFAYKAIRLA